MSTSREQIRAWVDEAKTEGATHLIVVTDTYDYFDYPVAVAPGKDIHEALKHYREAPMQHVTECYNLGMDIDAQMAERRAYHP